MSTEFTTTTNGATGNLTSGGKPDSLHSDGSARVKCENCGQYIGLRFRAARNKKYWTHELPKGHKGKGCKKPTPVPNDSMMLEWLLKNCKPGPVCWWRDKNGEEYLMASRADVLKRMGCAPNTKIRHDADSAAPQLKGQSNEL